MSPSRRKRIVVTDANVLINLIHVRRLGLLGALSDYEFVVPPEVEAEVKTPKHAKALAQAFAKNHMQRQSFTTTNELQLYAEHAKVLGKGESACLAMAEKHGLYLASDERRKFQRLCEARLGKGRLVNTPGIYVLAIRDHLLTVREADTDKRTLEKHRFKMNFSSFGELIQI